MGVNLFAKVPLPWGHLPRGGGTSLQQPHHPGAQCCESMCSSKVSVSGQQCRHTSSSSLASYCSSLGTRCPLPARGAQEALGLWCQAAVLVSWAWRCCKVAAFCKSAANILCGSWLVQLPVVEASGSSYGRAGQWCQEQQGVSLIVGYALLGRRAGGAWKSSASCREQHGPFHSFPVGSGSCGEVIQEGTWRAFGSACAHVASPGFSGGREHFYNAC